MTTEALNNSGHRQPSCKLKQKKKKKKSFCIDMNQKNNKSAFLELHFSWAAAASYKKTNLEPTYKT